MLTANIFFPLIILGISVLIAIILFVIYFTMENKGYGVPDILGIVGGSIIFVAGGTALITLLFTAFPYNPNYWFIETHNGTISNISNSFEAGTGSKSDAEYVIELEGKNIPLITYDSRILSFNKGDSITLNCTKYWSYSGTDTNSCSIKF